MDLNLKSYITNTISEESKTYDVIEFSKITSDIILEIRLKKIKSE